MNTTSEHNRRPIPANSAETPSTESGHVGRSVSLKKGPWTLDEDAILVDYVLKHGEGKWSNIHINTPLARCGKSCRLRWINHLRPDLKKGPLTREEERRIVELHAVMGNKWSLIATELPGRTDNEIKNYWNTRVKRHRRIGLPIYPPYIIPQALNENQQSGSTNLFSSGDVYRPNFAPNNRPYNIPALEFISLENNEPLYPSSLLDISTISLPLHIQNAYEHCLTSNHASSSGACLGSNHAAINGNDFLSDRAQSLELELPSLQIQTSSLGLNQIQSAECSQSCNLATDDSDSLEAILHESKRLMSIKNNYHQQTSHAFDMADDVMDTLFQDLHETNWEDRSLHAGNLLDVPLSIETISDFLLGSNSSGGMDITEDHALLGDAIGTFFRQ